MKSRIEFAQGTDIFYPGSAVDGTFFLEIEEPEHSYFVKLFILGEAKTQWNNEYRSKKIAKCVGLQFTSHASQGIIDIEKRLCAEGFNEKDVLAPGEHKFPFQFELPKDCHPVVRTQLGNIYYACKVSVCRVGEWKYEQCEKPFIVAPIFDLNSSPTLKNGQSSYNCTKIKSTLFRKGGELSTTLSIPKAGYAIGETIDGTIEVKNQTQKEIKHVRLSLIQYSEFVAFRQRGDFEPNAHFITSAPNTRRTVVEVTYTQLELNCPAGETKSTNALLQVPHATPSFECAIIRVYYELVARVVSDHPDDGCRMSVVIGTVAIADKVTLPQANCSPPVADNVHVDDGTQS